MLTVCPVEEKLYMGNFKGNDSIDVVRQLRFERTNELPASQRFAFNAFLPEIQNRYFIVILYKVLDTCAPKPFPVVLVSSESPLL